MATSVSTKMVTFARAVNAGKDPVDAAREAGYRETTVKSGMLAKLVARARAAGLIVDPEQVRADAAAQQSVATEAAMHLADSTLKVAAELERIALGGLPQHPAQLEAIREVLDRVWGKPQQRTDVTSGGGRVGAVAITEIVVEKPALAGG